MYAFAKVNQIERSLQSTRKRKSRSHVPNQVLLEQEVCIVDPLNIEEWLQYWRQQFAMAVRKNILNPKPCSPLLKLAHSELKQNATAGQLQTLRLPYLYDPHTLQIVDPELLRQLSDDKLVKPIMDVPSSQQPSFTVTKYMQRTSPSSNKNSPTDSSESGTSFEGINSLLLPTIRRRKPMEEIQQLYTHVATISTNCAQAYLKCQDLETVPNADSDPDLEPDALLLNVLAHQIGGLDVALSASMDKSCKLFLEGMREIIGTIDFVCDVRNAFYKPLSPSKTQEYEQHTTPITRVLDKVNTMIAFNDDLKYYLIKLQMEGLLVITWPLGSVNFINYLKSIQKTVNRLLVALDDNWDNLGFLEWEKHDEFLRDEYFKIMETFYFQKRRFANHYNSEMLHKLHYHAKWLNHIHEKYSKRSMKKNSSQTTKSKTNLVNSTDDTTNMNIPPQSKDSGDCSNRFQRHRVSKELIVELTNHLLHINNCRTKFIRLTMQNDLNNKKRNEIYAATVNAATVLQIPNTKIPREESCEILLNILQHQIQGLDIALSSEIFNSIKCFLHGLYDTSCSIMSIMSDKYYDQSTHDYLPLPPGYSSHQGGGGDQEESNKQNYIRTTLEALQSCNQLICKKKPKWKHTLLKLQLEALILTQCSLETDIFRKHIELMAGSAENAYCILNKQWFIPYLSIAWDTSSPEDQQVFQSYWELIETSFSEDSKTYRTEDP